MPFPKYYGQSSPTERDNDGQEEYKDIELQEYSAEDGTLLSAELWESWFTFYIGELIARTDVNIFPVETLGEG